MKRAFKAVESLLLRRNINIGVPTHVQDTKRPRDEVSSAIVVGSNKRRKLLSDGPAASVHVTAQLPTLSIKRNTLLSPQSVLAAPEASISTTVETQKYKSFPPLLKKIPSEVVLHMLTFLTCISDRSTLQTTCRQFQDLTNMDCILSVLYIQGEADGQHAAIMESDTPDEAQRRLSKFAKALNLEAIYMLGMIRAYCYEDVLGGVSLLRTASQRGHVKSSYALGLMLRDNEKDESTNMLLHAATQGYLPAQQEVFPADVVKSTHGELEADELSTYLDPPCLSSLLNRKFSSSQWLMSNDTSHCWNPFCGRWAYKQHAAGRDFNEIGHFAPNSTCIEAKDLDPTVASVLTCIGPVDSKLPSIPSPNQATSSSIPANFQLPQKVSRMKMCSSCRQAKYCSKLCQVFDWRSGRHKTECTVLIREAVERHHREARHREF